VNDFLRLRRARKVKKVPGIVGGFNLKTNPDERWLCYRALLGQRLAVSLPIGINSRIYRKSIQPYMFIASPPGNGEDCHRTWEALYLRIIPVVKRSVMTEYFKSVGLPMLLVDDWREMTSWSEDYLSETYDKLMPGFESEALWLSYWKTQFDKYMGRNG
jgi:hypothetical protein